MKLLLHAWRGGTDRNLSAVSTYRNEEYAFLRIAMVSACEVQRNAKKPCLVAVRPTVVWGPLSSRDRAGQSFRSTPNHFRIHGKPNG